MAKPKKACTSLTFRSSGQSWMTLTLLLSIVHLELECNHNTQPCPDERNICWRKHIACCSIASGGLHGRAVCGQRSCQSRLGCHQGRQVISRSSENILFMRHWKVAGALERPKGITRHSRIHSEYGGRFSIRLLCGSRQDGMHAGDQS